MRCPSCGGDLHRTDKKGVFFLWECPSCGYVETWDNAEEDWREFIGNGVTVKQSRFWWLVPMAILGIGMLLVWAAQVWMS